MIRFLREQKQYRQARTVCRASLKLFPGDEGLRLFEALIRLDLGESEEARKDIEELARNWSRLAPNLSALSLHPGAADCGALQEWLNHLARVLSLCPLRDTESSSEKEILSSGPSAGTQDSTSFPSASSAPHEDSGVLNRDRRNGRGNEGPVHIEQLAYPAQGGEGLTFRTKDPRSGRQAA